MHVYGTDFILKRKVYILVRFHQVRPRNCFRNCLCKIFISFLFAQNVHSMKTQRRLPQLQHLANQIESHLCRTVASMQFVLSLLTVAGIAAAQSGSPSQVVNHVGNYYVEFSYEASGKSVLQWDEARKICTDKGTGWYLAAPQDANDEAAIKTLIGNSLLNSAWTGGFTALPQIGAWVWADGRFAGVQYSSKPMGGSLSNFRYADWQSTEPSNYQCPTDTTIPPEYQMSATMNGWNDFVARYCSAVFVYVTHVLCERSACTVPADCVVANTITVSSSQFAPICD